MSSAQIFQPKDAPQYIPGKAAIMILLTIQLAISFLLRWINIRLNKKKLAFLEAEKTRRGWTDEDVSRERDRHAFLDMTDKVRLVQPGLIVLDLHTTQANPFFIYTQ
jgi:ACS family allantoate permease-like MFS transporter